jgi:tetratricopeptide (TPR) repeat protein
MPSTCKVAVWLLGGLAMMPALSRIAYRVSRISHPGLAFICVHLRFHVAAILLLFCCACEEGRGVDPQERAAMQAIFEQARALDDAGRYHEALVRYETILARHPEYMSTRLNAAMAAYDSGQYQKSAEHFEVLHKYGPGDWFVIRKLIQCYERLNNNEKVDL